MFISSLFSPRAPRQRKGRNRPRQSPRVGRGGKRLTFEQLEGRALLASWIAASVADLIADINAANLAGGSNTIELVAGKTFTLTAVDNTTNGANGLPVIVAGDNLTIVGNGDTIQRSTDPDTPAFRFFDVAAGAALTLKNLTLANGIVIGDTGMTAYGGAILNEAGGTLTVIHSTFTGNQAVGGDGGGGLGGLGIGGAIENQGAADFRYDTFSGNQAVGGATTGEEDEPPNTFYGPVYGAAFGGAIGNGTLGTLSVSHSSFIGNQAIGGLRRSLSSHYDGVAASGAIDSWNTAFITDTSFVDNQAIGGPADSGVDGGYGIGGAVGSGGPFAPSAVMTIRRCAFSDNQAIGADAGPDNWAGAGIGGAVSNGYTTEVAATMTITESTFTANQATGGEGGFAGGASGGAVNLESPCVTHIANSTFTGNQAYGGGGDFGTAGGGVIRNVDFGDIGERSEATLTISNSTFTGNQARGGTGGVYDGGIGGVIENINYDTVGSGAPVTISNCTFAGNQALGGGTGGRAAGGAILNFDYAAGGSGATLTVSNSAFTGNQALGAAGGDGVSPGGDAEGGAIDTFGNTDHSEFHFQTQPGHRRSAGSRCSDERLGLYRESRWCPYQYWRHSYPPSQQLRGQSSHRERGQRGRSRRCRRRRRHRRLQLLEWRDGDPQQLLALRQCRHRWRRRQRRVQVVLASGAAWTPRSLRLITRPLTRP